MQNKTLCLLNSLGNSRINSKCLPVTGCVYSKLQLDTVFNPRYSVVRRNKISYDIKHRKSELDRKKIFRGGKENILTVPNLLTFSRIVATPFLGYMVLHEHFHLSLGIFAYAGITDLLDGYIARNFSNQNSALGTALDPLADKLLVIVLTLSLTNVQLIPMSLTALIILRDVGLIASVFYIRYISLPPPKTLSRYFDVTLATAKLYPSMLSKINTALQLSLVALSLAAPVFHYVDHPLLQALWCATGITTFMSGLTYMLSWRKNFKVLVV
ncbi:cardiolipin synthase (CMP-forming)-like [Gigantopelta aegis]|uniref:cardiolipin synthase (CMP-forming)-like n=1 Tax=Gigantopelta aegis TaxID=1735272 RepID=UPI001B8897B8|nr:cardiolipin synthase (CMP-forming)-like [Gigantopelta aegis]